MAARQQHPPGALETSYSSQKRSCSCNLQWQHVSNIHQEHLKLPTHRKNAPAVATYNGSTSATYPPGALETSYSSQKRSCSCNLQWQHVSNIHQEHLKLPTHRKNASCSCNLQWQHVSNIHQEHLKLPTHRKNAPAVATYNGSTSATSTRST